MKILVAVKRVVDYRAVIRVKADHSGVDIANVKMAMNPFDEIALEAAIRFKEQGLVAEVVALSIGTDASQETLRTALAFGADRGILIKTDTQISPLVCAKIIANIAQKEAPQCVLLGKQAIDDDNNQTAQMLAGLLNWAQGTFASKLVLENGGMRVTREIDGGLETLFLQLPVIVSVDLR
jgi:electron transfer flavoprotein beta subunit